jgi:hypothetical protein
MNYSDQDIELLLALSRSELTPDQERQLRERIKAEPELRSLHEMIAGLIDLKRSYSEDSLVRAALELSSRMINTYRGERVSAGPVGVCVFDSAVLPTPSAVRPAAVDTRHLKYRIGNTELVLALYPISPEAYELMGRLSGTEFEDAVTVDLSSGRRAARTELDRYRLFRFDRVTAGSYRMTLRAGQQEIGEIQLDL